jgi:hypothetical protein
VKLMCAGWLDRRLVPEQHSCIHYGEDSGVEGRAPQCCCSARNLGVDEFALGLWH